VAREEAFNAAKFAFASYDAFFAAVVSQLGQDRARALESGALERLGAAQGQMIKQQLGGTTIDAQTAYSVLQKSVLEALGISSQMQQASPQKVTFEVGRCPIYESGRTLGLDHATIEGNCRASSICMMNALTHQLNPNLSYRLLTFRSGPDSGCIEEIAST
jgi:hypothetical protein